MRALFVLLVVLSVYTMTKTGIITTITGPNGETITVVDVGGDPDEGM